ncbi:thrombospondin type 3 repeat-containing protein [Flectobacillus sp. DC10W]|uniref:Thrombospondin type 3 repeat-containing protein n=1 Tax=Flectobacillus longus TaxID=2984207 RepID=A0ABT6YSD2_9BACT|nr:thrombospondin type 3 repeat-containing protein [Flectobacillus longus]MDI9866349.1 thrombospondin type 3 repeat-containing protein [Flectobacillus longus]
MNLDIRPLFFRICGVFVLSLLSFFAKSQNVVWATINEGNFGYFDPNANYKWTQVARLCPTGAWDAMVIVNNTTAVAFNASTDNFYKIDLATGRTTPLGVPAGVDATYDFELGAFDSATGKYYIAQEDAATPFYVINYATWTLSSTVTMSTAINCDDWTFYNGLLYGSDDGDRSHVYINPTTGVINKVQNTTGVMNNVQIAGIWMGTDNLIYVLNENEQLYQATPDADGLPAQRITSVSTATLGVGVGNDGDDVGGLAPKPTTYLASQAVSSNQEVVWGMINEGDLGYFDPNQNFAWTKTATLSPTGNWDAMALISSTKALAFNAATDNFYEINLQTGVATPKGVPAGVNSSRDYELGTFDPATGYYYVAEEDASTPLVVINYNTWTFVKEVTPSIAYSVDDFAFKNGKLYGTDDGDRGHWIMDPNTGVITKVDDGCSYNEYQIVGAFIGADGNLWSVNDIEEVYVQSADATGLPSKRIYEANVGTSLPNNDVSDIGGIGLKPGAIVPDSDGDGFADNVDSAPNDPCLPAQSSGYTGYNAANSIWVAADCDGDTFTNGAEVTAGTDPYNPNSKPVDTAAGTIDCAKTTMIPSPVVGTPSQIILSVTVNVTKAGTFAVSASGSGMTLASGISSVSTTTTGVKTFYIPLDYDGSTLGVLTFSIGTNACTANLSSTTAKKKALVDVWTLDNCTIKLASPALK